MFDITSVALRPQRNRTFWEHSTCLFLKTGNEFWLPYSNAFITIHCQDDLSCQLSRTSENSGKHLLEKERTGKVFWHTHTHTGHAICRNGPPSTQALLLQSSMIVLDMVQSLMLTDAHLLGSSDLFIYLFICVRFIYWWAPRIQRQNLHLLL